MKLLVVSDNHGDRDILVKLQQEYVDKMDLMIHCGDSELAVDDEIFDNMPSVLGNNDWGQPFPEKRLLEVASERVLVTHGHLYNVNFNLDELVMLARRRNASIIAYGHTHQLAVTMQNGRLYINPGSISLPRGEYSYLGGTYAIITTSKTQVDVQYYNRAMEPVEDLHFTFERNMK